MTHPSGFSCGADKRPRQQASASENILPLEQRALLHSTFCVSLDQQCLMVSPGTASGVQKKRAPVSSPRCKNYYPTAHVYPAFHAQTEETRTVLDGRVAQCEGLPHPHSASGYRCLSAFQVRTRAGWGRSFMSSRSREASMEFQTSRLGSRRLSCGPWLTRAPTGEPHLCVTCCHLFFLLRGDAGRDGGAHIDLDKFVRH